jgi:hypothetical protein
MNTPEQHEKEQTLAWPLTTPDADKVKEWIRSVLPDKCEVVGPTHIYAQYTDAPDIRATARFEALPQNGPGVVFKANYFPLLASSPRFFHLLSQHCPGIVPHVLAWEERDGGSFLLCEAFEGELVSQLKSPDPLLDTARTLARIQTIVANLPESETNLLPRLEVARLPFLFADVLAHLRLHYNAAWAGDNEKLTQWLGFPASQVLERLEPLQSEVLEWAQALASSPVPLSIDHGDLHAGNAIRQPDGTMLIYDWENACLSCPLFSVEKLLVSAWAVDRQAQDAGPWGWISGTPMQLAVKQVYLESVTWASRAERDHLFDMAMCLAVIKEMHSEIEWAETMGWANGNPEWTAQLISRLFQHRRAVTEMSP